MSAVSGGLFMCQALYLHDLMLLHCLEVRFYNRARFRDEKLRLCVRDVLSDTDML